MTLDKNNLYSQMLYVGLVCEKGNIYQKFWRFRYRKRLILQSKIWDQILNIMTEDVFNETDKILLENITKVIKDDDQLYKYYNVPLSIIGQIRENSYSDINSTHIAVKEREIIDLMKELNGELLANTKKIFVNKRLVHNILDSMHNLPRVFLPSNQSNYRKIDINDAIDYSFNSMNNQLKNKYSRYRKR